MEQTNIDDIYTLNEPSVEEEPIENWDKIVCEICGKTVSMLDAKLIDESYFICRRHLINGED